MDVMDMRLDPSLAPLQAPIISHRQIVAVRVLQMHSQELAAAIAEDEQETTAGQAGATQTIHLTPRRKQHDPQMKVYLRLQADAKWYDISDEDIRTWFGQLSHEGYERNKRNAEHTIKQLQYLVSLIEEGQKRMSEGE